jgi:hypothetical protein
MRLHYITIVIYIRKYKNKAHKMIGDLKTVKYVGAFLALMATATSAYACRLAEGVTTCSEETPPAYDQLVWRQMATGDNWSYEVNADFIVSSYPLNKVSTEWRLVGRSDFNGDGKTDLFWRHQNGTNWIYLLDGESTLVSRSPGVVPSEWDIVGFGDANADGTDDVFWQHQTTGQLYVHMMQGATVISAKSIVKQVAAEWAVESIGDLSGDGRADVLWRNSATHDVWVYQLDGANISQSYGLNRVGLEWSMVSLGDFNGDGQQDILWRNTNTGTLWVYMMNNGHVALSYRLADVANMDWTIASLQDTNGDGVDDVVWRNRQTGENWLYIMGEGSIGSSKRIATVADTNWRICSDDPGLNQTESDSSTGELIQGQIALSWDAVLERQSGAAMTEEQLGGFLVRYTNHDSNVQRVVSITDGSARETVLSGLVEGLYSVEVATVDKHGFVSDYSAAVSLEI